MALVRLLKRHDHALPQVGRPTGSVKSDDPKSRLLEKRLQGRPGPKLNVSVVPKGSEMSVQLARRRKNQILDVSVVRRRNDRSSPWAQQSK